MNIIRDFFCFEDLKKIKMLLRLVRDLFGEIFNKIKYENS